MLNVERATQRCFAYHNLLFGLRFVCHTEIKDSTKLKHLFYELQIGIKFNKNLNDLYV